METKNKEVVLHRMKCRLHFLHLHVYNPVGSVGGLAVLWNASITLTFISSTSDYFDMTCKDEEDGKT